VPGYSDEKSKIFVAIVAIVAKNQGVAPDGWQKAAGKFGDDVPRSAESHASLTVLCTNLPAERDSAYKFQARPCSVNVSSR
jgi:hypothetical protein